MSWLNFEVEGWPQSGPLPPNVWSAAVRSGRVAPKPDGKPGATVSTLGELAAGIPAATAQLASAADPDVSISSANPGQYVHVPAGNSQERAVIRRHISDQQAVIDRVVGAIHSYVTKVHLELRFGDVVETAFEALRSEVDGAIGELVPEAASKLASAFENAGSENSEDWAAAAASCRRLIKACADALRPPGEPVEGRPMTDQNYVNRLVDWIAREAGSDTERGMIVGDLDFLCKKLDAVDAAGQKGAHAEVTKFEAARYVTGTYLTLGDLLRLRSPETEVDERDPEKEVAEGPSG
jgi:hypothetical protein